MFGLRVLELRGGLTNGVFYEGELMLYIHPDECIECEACVPKCPVEAIFQEDDLPEEWSTYTALNVEMVEECEVITEPKAPLIDAGKQDQ